MRKIIPVLGLAVAILVTGCASDNSIDDSGYSTKPLYNRQGQKLSSADTKLIYESARDFMMHGKPEEALPLYDEVSARFPFSKYATQADLEVIDAHYRDKDYEQTVKAADRFIKQHPRYPHVDYAYYMRGLAHYAQNNPGWVYSSPDMRNVSSLKQAFNDFSLLVRNFPNSAYAKDAQLHMVDARNRIADFYLRIAEYYYTRRAYVAASRQAENVVKRYQGSGAVPRALEIMQESYGKLQLPDMSSDARAMLQASYPEYVLNRAQFYQQADTDHAADSDDDSSGS